MGDQPVDRVPKNPGTKNGAQPSPPHAASITALPVRGRAVGRGYVDSITVLPASAAPSFTAILSDPVRSDPVRSDPVHTESVRSDPVHGGFLPGRSVRRAAAGPGERPRPGKVRARMRLIWLGQRTVPGIEVGTELTFEGMVRPVDGLPTVYNPRYAILSHQEDQP